MGMLESFGQRRFMKEGAGKPVPERGAGRFFVILGTNIWKLLSLNLLFVLFSLPVVTLPAALIAQNHVCVQLVRRGYVLLWQEFWDEFRRSFLRSLPLGLLFGGGLAAAYYLLSLGASNAGSVYGMLFAASGLFFAALFLLWGAWTFVLAAMLDAGNRVALRNARVLLCSEWRRDLGILCTLLSAGAPALLLFPFSLIGIALLLPTLVQYIVCFLINTPVQARILDPFAQSEKREVAS